jgi:hypothetical protein
MSAGVGLSVVMGAPVVAVGLGSVGATGRGILLPEP